MTGNELHKSMATLQVPVADMARRCQTTRPTIYSLLARGDEQLPAKWEPVVSGALEAVQLERAAWLAELTA